ncbi:hypothetical protein VF21_10376 [Pseudogymnoascus sp. 05NY08]|nr:hypothetical protein VF21_10376 [Pseudogymnoascus sp. 05NY08]
MSNNASGIRITNPNEFARCPTASPPSFNPYDALSIPVAAYTVLKVNQHFRQAQRHLLCASANAPAFPSRAEVNSARDYLLEVAACLSHRQRGAFAQWERLPRTFFRELNLGAPGVFVPRAAPNPSPRAAPSTRRSRAAPHPRRKPGDPFYTPPPRPQRPPPHRRQRHPSDSPPMQPPPPRRSNSPARTPPRTRSQASAGAGATLSSNTPHRDQTGNSSGYTRRERTPPFGSAGGTWDSSACKGDSSRYTRRERTPPMFGSGPHNPQTISNDDNDNDDDDAPVPPTPTPSH